MRFAAFARRHRRGCNGRRGHTIARAVLNRRGGGKARHLALARDAVLVIPADIVEAVAEEALKNYEYEEWAEGEVRKGRSLKGLFPVQGDQAKADYEAWRKSVGKK